MLAEDERRRDLTVREARGDQAQHLGLAARERRGAVRGDGRRVVQEPSERTLDFPLVVHVREMRVAA